MKALVRTVLVTLMASGGLSGYSLTIGKDTTVGIQTQKIIEKIKGIAGGSLPEMEWLKLSAPDEKKDESFRPVLQACVDSMFFQKGAYHFTQSKWGAQSVPYQFRGMELIGPKELTLNGADEARGIERRLFFEFYIESFRVYDKTEGWGSWQVDMPPNLGGITLVLHAGTWKVASSPQQAYNLK